MDDEQPTRVSVELSASLVLTLALSKYLRSELIVEPAKESENEQ